MTTADLVKKFKNVGLTKEKLVLTITDILKKLKPEQKKIDKKLYLWLKKSDWFPRLYKHFLRIVTVSYSQVQFGNEIGKDRKSVV